jgi:SAM-dependent methyltransferase
LNHDDHVALLRGGVPGQSGTWADLGSGTGAFTLALTDLLGTDSIIYSIDQNANALRDQEMAMRASFPNRTVYYQVADFTRRLKLPLLDGVVMANTLHFHRDKDAILQLVRAYLRPAGRLLIVEYGTDNRNTWVPFPSWEILATRNGFINTRLLASRPSRFLGEIYSAVSFT